MKLIMGSILTLFTPGVENGLIAPQCVAAACHMLFCHVVVDNKLTNTFFFSTFKVEENKVPLFFGSDII